MAASGWRTSIRTRLITVYFIIKFFFIMNLLLLFFGGGREPEGGDGFFFLNAFVVFFFSLYFFVFCINDPIALCPKKVHDEWKRKRKTTDRPVQILFYQKIVTGCHTMLKLYTAATGNTSFKVVVYNIYQVEACHLAIVTVLLSAHTHSSFFSPPIY